MWCLKRSLKTPYSPRRVWTVAVRDRPQLAHVRDNHLMAQLFKLFADPDRMNTSLHRNASMWHIGEPCVDRLRRRPETTAVDHFALLVESAVTAPNVAEVMPIVSYTWPRFRGTPAMRCCVGFFMGTVCSSSGGPAHPIYRYLRSAISLRLRLEPRHRHFRQGDEHLQRDAGETGLVPPA